MFARFIFCSEFRATNMVISIKAWLCETNNVLHSGQQWTVELLVQYCIQDNNEIFRLLTSLSCAKKFRVKSINSRSEERGLYDYKFLLYLSVIRTRIASSRQLRQGPSECNKERMLTDPVDAEGRNTETQCTHPFHLQPSWRLPQTGGTWRVAVRKLYLK